MEDKNKTIDESLAEKLVLDLDAVSIQSRLLPFWREIPGAWFIQFEIVIDPLKTSDDQKYRFLLQQLQPADHQYLTDILYNPPKTDKYIAVKNQLLAVYEKSEVQNFQKLISGLELRDQKPSHLLRRMRELGNGMNTDSGLKIEWLNQLPTHIRCVLSVNDKSSLETLAAMAVKMLENSGGTSTIAAMSTATAPTNETNLHFEILSKQHAKLTLDITELRGPTMQRSYRHPFHSRRPFNSRSKSNQRRPSAKPGDPKWKYHLRYGDEARRCELPSGKRKKTEN